MAVFAPPIPPQEVYEFLEKNKWAKLEDITWFYSPERDKTIVRAKRFRRKPIEEITYDGVHPSYDNAARLVHLWKSLEGFVWNVDEEKDIIEKITTTDVAIKIIEEPPIDYEEVARLYNEIHNDKEKKSDS